MAQRIHEVAAEHGCGVEVFCFGPAGTVAGPRRSRRSTRADGSEDLLLKRGLTLRVARDEFLRFTLEGASVITF